MTVPSPSVVSIFFFLLVSFFSSRILCRSIEVESHHHKHHKHNNNNNNNDHALFVFGDSYFDPGNNNYINTSTLDQSNFPPYGETYFGFPTGRFSDGRIIPDFISEYAKLPLIRPYMEPGRRQMSREKYIYGANFASAGAGALLETFHGSVISLQTQIRYHKRVANRLRKIYGKTEARKILSKAVYLFSIGTNDYISPYLITNSTHNFNSTKSDDQLIEIVIGNITTAITELHKRGGRKFGFLNLGPLGCIPGLRIINLNPPGGCIKAASLLANLHNQAFTKALKGLAKHLHGFKYSLYNANSFLQHRLKHPSKYGYKQGKTACCGTGRFRGTYSCGGKRPPVKEFKVCENPKDYLFWDSYHLTERAYKEMASQMWSQKANTGTYNLKTLFQLQ